MTEEPDLTAQIKELISNYRSQITERDRIIERLQSDLISLSTVAADRGILKPLPETEPKPPGVI